MNGSHGIPGDLEARARRCEVCLRLDLLETDSRRFRRAGASPGISSHCSAEIDSEGPTLAFFPSTVAGLAKSRRGTYGASGIDWSEIGM